MKTTEELSRQTLTINGDLLKAIFNGGIVISYKFNGWDWYVLVKHPKGKFKVIEDEHGRREFQYTEFQTFDNNEFYETTHRNGTSKEVLAKFKKEFYETYLIKERAFKLGNID